MDPAGLMDIVGIYAGHSFEFVLELFEDDETTAKNFAGTLTFIICTDQDRKLPYMTLTEGSGLTTAGNKVTVQRTKAENKLRPGRYFYALQNDLSADTSLPIVQGSITVKPSR